jgi:uncharacterized membrane protein YdjX (TVP38/TMEM64 family)
VALTLLPTLGVVVGILAIFLLNPGLQGEFREGWSLLWAGEAEGVRSWLLSYGGWAPFLSVALQVATSVFPPGPSFLLAIANAMVFGPVFGALLTFGGALLSAAICFGIARVVGRPGVEKIVSPSNLQRMDDFMARRGMVAVFLGRLIPFINPDLVSYGAGVTAIGWVPFLLSMAAGTVPSTVFYTLVGSLAVEVTGWIVGLVAVSSIVPLAFLVFARRRLYQRRAAERSAREDRETP